MSDQVACCAHKRVYHVAVKNGDGTFSDRWECGDCKHQFWPAQAEVDALVAMARGDGLRLAELASKQWHTPNVGCKCEICEAIIDAERTPTDAQKALEAHDAALREMHIEREQWLGERSAKLEAENAGLRESLEWAVYALEHGSSVEVHWLKYVAKAQHDKARALLAKSGAPK